MSNISITDSQLDEMLRKLSIDRIEDLFKIIPNTFKYDINTLSIKDALSEQELTNYFNNIGDKNLNSSNSPVIGLTYFFFLLPLITPIL